VLLAACLLACLVASLFPGPKDWPKGLAQWTSATRSGRLEVEVELEAEAEAATTNRRFLEINKTKESKPTVLTKYFAQCPGLPSRALFLEEYTRAPASRVLAVHRSSSGAWRSLVSNLSSFECP